MKTVSCITVRMSSGRLPGKVMADICGKPALERVVDRHLQIEAVDDIVVATSTDPLDDPIEEWCSGSGIRCYRGSLDNVCDRIYNAVVELAPDYVIRGLGDCTFIEPRLVDMMVDVLSLHNADAARPVTEANKWPVYGAAESPYSWNVIETLNERSSGSQCEHFGAYLDEHRDEFNIIYPQGPPGYYTTYYPPYRLELDTETDLWMFRQIYEALGTDREPPLYEVIRFLDNNQDLAITNSSIAEKTGPLTSFTPEQRRKWNEQKDGRVVDWGSRQWSWLQGHKADHRAVWCDAGRCYLGYVLHHGRGQANAIVRPNGDKIFGDASIACSCGTGREWRQTRR